MTPKQERFIQEYLIDLNATQAAIRAGYSGRTAGQQASRMLKSTGVQAAVRLAMQERQQRVRIDQDYVIGKLREIADMDASDASNSELKFSGKLKALELLGRHLGLFDDRMRIPAGPDTGILKDILAQLREPDAAAPGGPEKTFRPDGAAAGPRTGGEAAGSNG